MNLNKRLRSLEGQLAEEEKNVKALLLDGKMPMPGDYGEVARIRRVLKTARWQKTACEKRTDQKLTRSYTIKFSRMNMTTFRTGEKSGHDFAKYIRHLKRWVIYFKVIIAGCEFRLLPECDSSRPLASWPGFFMGRNQKVGREWGENWLSSTKRKRLSI